MAEETSFPALVFPPKFRELCDAGRTNNFMKEGLTLIGAARTHVHEELRHDGDEPPPVRNYTHNEASCNHLSLLGTSHTGAHYS